MSSTTFDADVEFETEEETSEYEDDEEVKTVLIKLPTSTHKTEIQKLSSTKTTSDVETCDISKTQEFNDEHPSKKSSKIKVSKESNDRILENGHDSNPSKNDFHVESLNKFKGEAKDAENSSKTKLDFDSMEETGSSKKHKDKSEKRKSREESKKLLSEVDEGEVSSKKSSKSKKDKFVDHDETSNSSKKKDKHVDDESYSSKSKKDKHEKSFGDEVSTLEFAGDVSEVKEKTKSKKKRSSVEVENKYLDKPSPSSSSSDLDKPRSDKYEFKLDDNKSPQTDEQNKIIKIKKKSKKSSELNDLERNLEEVGTTHEPQIQIKTEEVLTSSTNEEGSLQTEITKCLENENTLKPVDEDVEKVQDLIVQDDETKTLSTNERERDPVSPAAAGRIEQTRNYLKALTPEDGYRSASDDERPNQKASAIFEIAKRDEPGENEFVDKDGKEHVWEPKPEPEINKEKVVDNEDSDFTYRRKSMDEFIKKILAEAREENIKLKEDTHKSKKPPTNSRPKPKTPTMDETLNDVDNDDDESTEKKSVSRKPRSSDNQPITIDVSKELDEINKYFAKRNEEHDTNEEKSRKTDKEHVIKENGFLENDGMDDDTRDDRIAYKQKKNHSSNYINLEDDENLSNKRQKHYAQVTKKPVVNALINGDVSYGREDEGEETADITDFLVKFKRERQALFGGPGAGRLEPEPKRSAETEELIRDKTRNMKSVIDQQMDICQNVRVVSKQLDDLEKELREVRQISLDRRSKMEAMENAVNAEYKIYEIEHQAAVDRVKDKKPIQKFTQEVKDQMFANIQQQQAARAKKNERYRGDLTSDDVASNLRRRVGSVSSQAALLDEQDNFFMSSSPASSSPYHSFAPSRGRGTSSDRDPYLSSFLTDRRREGSGGGSRSRLSFIDNGNDFDDLPVPTATQSILFNKPKSRASVATMDTSSSITADDFLAKMRSKYSFLNPNQTSEDVSSASNRSHLTSRTSGNSGYRPLSSTQSVHDSYRSRLEEPSSSYLSIKNTSGRGPSPSSLYDTPGSRYSLAAAGAGRYSGLTGLSSLSSYEPPKSRRATSVSDVRVQYDRNLGGYTTSGTPGYGGNTAGSSRYSLGSSRYSDSSNHLYTPSHPSSTSSGGEFKSRFLDKVREKRSSVGSSSSHDLADRVRARLNSSKSAASYDLPTPPSSTKHGSSAASVNVENVGVEA